MSLKRLSVVLLSTIGLAASASTAQAEMVVTTANPIEKAVAIADAYWGGSYCGGNYPIAYATNPSVPVNAGPANQEVAEGKLVIQAWARFGDPTCTINLNSSIWTPVSEVTRFQDFCDVITHEIGHFFGHGDEGQTDPTSIQYPTIEETSPNYNSVPGCIGVQIRTETWVTSPAEKAEEVEALKETAAVNRHHHKKAPKRGHQKAHKKPHKRPKKKH